MLRAVFQLAEVGDLHEARTGVIRFVAGNAVDFGRVRDDFVDGQAEMRWQQHEIFEPALDRLGHRVLDRFGGDPFSVPGHVGLQQELVPRSAQLTVAARFDCCPVRAVASQSQDVK